jgi:hypothetical protein
LLPNPLLLQNIPASSTAKGHKAFGHDFPFLLLTLIEMPFHGQSRIFDREVYCLCADGSSSSMEHFTCIPEKVRLTTSREAGLGCASW